jgi:DNA-binding MurR/RpiR family transcriptional regulator
MHTDVTQIITKAYPTLSDGGRKIADFLLARPNEILDLTVKTLAQKTGVSIATVSRFAQNLGFESFKQLQLAIASNAHEQSDYILNIHADSHDPFSQIEKVATAEAETISLSLKNLDKTALNTCADLLHKANRILFFGLGSSFFACEDAALKYKRLQKFAVAFNNTHDAAGTAIHTVDFAINDNSAGLNTFHIKDLIGILHVDDTFNPDRRSICHIEVAVQSARISQITAAGIADLECNDQR